VIYPHSPVRDGLAQLDEGNFVESLPTGSPTLRAFAAWGFFAESWWLLACGLAKVGRPLRVVTGSGLGCWGESASLTRGRARRPPDSRRDGGATRTWHLLAACSVVQAGLSLPWRIGFLETHDSCRDSVAHR
jgi:hypothetical protein